VTQRWYARPVFFVSDVEASRRREMSERHVSFETMWWGYDSIRLVDPDGDALLFPCENQ
jgi:hypothetical protein